MSGGALWALGLMSGTSLDGVDAALVRTDGERAVGFGPSMTAPYSDAEREALRGFLGLRSRADMRAAEADRLMTDVHVRAVATLLERTEIRPDVVGFHGQTLFHDPANGVTIQAGDGAGLARRVGLPVVYDFRSADVAAGGEGAPLAPAWHVALSCDLVKPLAVLNLGGVGNVTWIGANRETPPLAFDTGPGNALIDDLMQARRNLACDQGGRLALSGAVDRRALERLLDNPFFLRAPPKSLDRDAFSPDAVNGLDDADAAATLTAFTVESVRLSLRWMPEKPLRWLVCGGGRRNDALMSGLARALGAPVAPVESVGWDGDALEAQAFGFLAVRSLKGLPLSWPSTTGAPKPTPGGVYAAP